jgi:Bacterial regulatory proteins, gntR family
VAFSIAQTTWYQLSGVDLRVIEQLDFYHRSFARVFPSQQHLAVKLHVSVRTVRRSIARLKHFGLLTVQARRYRDRQGRIRSHSNCYRLLSFIGGKVRSLLARLTGRPSLSSRTKTKEKTEPLSPFPHTERDKPPSPFTLAHPLLRIWLLRGAPTAG